MQAAALLLWLGVGVILYTYVGYAVIMYLLLQAKRLFVSRKELPDAGFLPEITVVIPCYNEGDVLEEKVRNCFALDYPKEKMQIIFITDGSTDGSEEVLSRISGITVLHQPLRAGKAAAENRAMQHVRTPFVIFCDANTKLNRGAIREIVKHYADEKTGAVAGEKRVLSHDVDTASAAGEGLYWKYESFLKRLDSEVCSTIGGAGELVSFRTALYQPLDEDTILDDFMQSMRIALAGYRVVYEPAAYAEEHASANVGEETKRKIRISAGAWQAMTRLGAAFNPFSHFLLTFTFVSHKVLRWTLAPLALLIIIPANIYLHLHVGGMYTWLLYAQGLFYVLAVFGWYFENRQIRVKAFFLPYYFLITNACMFPGFFRFLGGRQSVKWERVSRAT